MGKRFVAADLPGPGTDCGWIETLPSPSPPRSLRGTRRVDAAVLGAGFTGLAAARRLAELAPGRRIALVEARRAGAGASGRSSGFVVALAHFIARMRPAHGERFVRLSRRGIAALGRQVRTHRLACGWNDHGWIHAAAGDAGEATLEELIAWLDRRHEPYRRLDREALEAITGTSFYRAGVRLPGSVLVQPAALARGLAAGLPPDVELFEESPVVEIEPGTPVRVRAAGGGELVADRVLLALNGTAHALGLLRDRIFPLWTFGSLSRPLSKAEIARVGGDGEWGLLAQDPLGSSLRRTADDRLLIRNTVAFSRSLACPRSARERARREHRRALAVRWPALADLPLAYTWGGAMGISRNGAHFFGRIAPGTWAAGGYNAAGIALGTVCGELLAEAALGVDSPDLADLEALPQASWLPPDPLVGLGVWWRARRMARVAGVPV